MQTGGARCPECQAVFRESVRYCPECGTFIGVSCQSCDALLSAGAAFCSNCGSLPGGTGVPNPESGTLTYRLSGEKKHITLLFADLVGSTDMLSSIGLEEGRRLFEAVTDQMKAAIVAFDGIVNQVKGDGVMALFGAPRALEDHAMRACCAAMRMQDAMAGPAFTEVLGRPVAIRVGLHSGEVVVTEQGRGFDHHYTAFGLAAHVAARLEQAAEPGRVLMSSNTHALVAGRVDVRQVGWLNLKGIAAPVEAAELLHVASGNVTGPSRGIRSEFVGRDHALDLLKSTAMAVHDCQGSSVVITGEPGAGKTRLCREFLHTLEGEFGVIEAAGFSFPPQAAYGVVVDLLRACMELEASRPTDARAWLALLGVETPAHADVLHPLLLFDALADGAPPTPAFRHRQAQIAAAVIHVLHRAARHRPVIVFIDDLQWADDASAQVLSVLMQQIAETRILLLANSRKGGLPIGIRDAGAALIELEAFTEDEAFQFLDGATAPGQLSEAARQRLFHMTGGNALFLEEVLKVNHTSGSGFDDPGATLPSRVQDLLTMRIDRLSAPSKAALQAAAVLGLELEDRHLAQVAGLTPAAVDRVLAELHDAAFLLPSSDERRGRWVFRHVLGHDAVYAGLLREQQKRLHARALNAMESSSHAEPSALSFHAKRSEDWQKTYGYSVAAGKVSSSRAAPEEAMSSFGDALVALGKLPAGDQARRAELDLRFLIRNTLFSLGRAPDIGEHLLAASSLAELLGDRDAQARALTLRAHHAWQMGQWRQAIALGEHALALAVSIGNVGLMAMGIFYMGLSTFALGRFKTGAELLRHNGSLLNGDLAAERFGFVPICSVVSNAYLALCLTELGQFEAAGQAAAAAQKVAQRAGTAFDRIQADLAVACVGLAQGDADRHLGLLEGALTLCRVASVAVLLPRASSALAFAFALVGRKEEALTLVAERQEQSGEAVRAISLLGTIEALLLCGATAEALARAETLVCLAQRTDQHGAEAWGTLMLASGHLALGQWRSAAASASAAHGAGLDRGMHPLAVRADLVRAVALACDGGAATAGLRRDERVQAAVLTCEQSGMGAWVGRVLGGR